MAILKGKRRVTAQSHLHKWDKRIHVALRDQTFPTISPLVQKRRIKPVSLSSIQLMFQESRQFMENSDTCRG